MKCRFTDEYTPGYTPISYLLRLSQSRIYATSFPGPLSYPSLSLSRSVGADRREPWEQGWNLQTPASAEMNKRGFFSRRPLPSLPNLPPYFPYVPISPYPFRRLLHRLGRSVGGNTRLSRVFFPHFLMLKLANDTPF